MPSTAYSGSTTSVTLERPVSTRNRIHVGTVTFAADYAAGGFSIAAADAGFTTLTAVIPGNIKGFLSTWDYAGHKLVIYDLSTGAEAADNLAGLSGKTCKIVFVGVV